MKSFWPKRLIGSCGFGIVLFFSSTICSNFLARPLRLKIGFTGIDKPELKQTCVKEGAIDPCGVIAKEILIKKIGDNKVNCSSEGKDQYKRTLVECFVNDESLSSYLVRSGYAFAYRRYSKKFIADENYAKDNAIGMWSMKFDYPWVYRKIINEE